MQMLQGHVAITNKIQEMVKNSTSNFTVFDSVSDISNLFHSDVFDLAEKVSIQLKIVIPPLTIAPDILFDIIIKKIRVSDIGNSDKRCFIVNDSKEVLIFIRNTIILQDKLLHGGLILNL